MGNNFSLGSIYPNPTNGAANIIVDNMEDKYIQLKLTNILGSEIKLLFDGVVLSKQKAIDADLSGLENGVYFITIYSEGRTVLTDKIVLFR